MGLNTALYSSFTFRPSSTWTHNTSPQQVHASSITFNQPLSSLYHYINIESIAKKGTQQYISIQLSSIACEPRTTVTSDQLGMDGHKRINRKKVHGELARQQSRRSSTQGSLPLGHEYRNNWSNNAIIPRLKEAN